MDKPLSPMNDDRRAGLTEREHGAPQDEPLAKSYRSPGQRDRDRILYTGALQRLATVTQVAPSESGHTFHNRLSHSLKVAQVGRRNAERLRHLVEQKHVTGAAATLIETVDPDAVEASCLAHDLGHPPFGHIAEDVLHAAASPHVADGFEGTAQSFRIVTRLAVRSEEPGLNLTRQTLDGLLKYPWAHRDPDPLERRNHKWGHYADDARAFKFARAAWPEETKQELPERCLEAEIMEWADDLTYAVHDVDDFFRAGLIPLDRLQTEAATELSRLERLLDEARDADPAGFPGCEIPELVEAARKVASLHGLAEPYEHTAAHRASMRQFGSDLITEYLAAFTVVDDPSRGAPRLKIDTDVRRQVDALKMLVVVYVVRRPGLAVVQHGQARVISDLFEYYFEASAPGKEGDRRLFPPGVKERLERAPDTSAERARIVVDLISGLTEASAIRLHHRLSGGWTEPTLDATAQMG